MHEVMGSISRAALRAGLSVSLVVLGASSAWAHPDHTGSEHYGLSHMVFDPFHASFLLGAVVIAVAAWRVHARRTKA